MRPLNLFTGAQTRAAPRFAHPREGRASARPCSSKGKQTLAPPRIARPREGRASARPCSSKGKQTLAPPRFARPREGRASCAPLLVQGQADACPSPLRTSRPVAEREGRASARPHSFAAYYF